MTVLVSSVSKKIPLIKAIRKALEKLTNEGKIVGADVDSQCIGKYFVDQFWKIPLLSDLTPKALISYCQSHGVCLIIPTRDGELEFFAHYKDLFTQQGIHVMISSEEGVSTCLDKYRFYQILSSKGFPVIHTTTALDGLESASYVVKERVGAGSRKIGIHLSRQEALEYANHLQDPIFQPQIQGEEISVDMYIDRSGRTKGVVARTRELVINGESQVTKTFQNQGLESLCVKVAGELKLYGHVMFQLIHSQDNEEFYLLECNSRFGGASTLSLETGLDSFYWFFLEVLGENLSLYPFKRSQKEKRLVRHAEDWIF